MQKDEKKHKFDHYTPRHALYRDCTIYTIHNRIVVIREKVLHVDQRIQSVSTRSFWLHQKVHEKALEILKLSEKDNQPDVCTK